MSTVELCVAPVIPQSEQHGIGIERLQCVQMAVLPVYCLYSQLFGILKWRCHSIGWCIIDHIQLPLHTNIQTQTHICMESAVCEATPPPIHLSSSSSHQAGFIGIFSSRERKSISSSNSYSSVIISFPFHCISCSICRRQQRQNKSSAPMFIRLLINAMFLFLFWFGGKMCMSFPIPAHARHLHSRSFHSIFHRAKLLHCIWTSWFDYSSIHMCRIMCLIIWPNHCLVHKTPLSDILCRQRFETEWPPSNILQTI